MDIIDENVFLCQYEESLQFFKSKNDDLETVFELNDKEI